MTKFESNRKGGLPKIQKFELFYLQFDQRN